MTDHGLGSWPRRRAGMTPGKAALVQDGVVTTYAQLDRATPGWPTGCGRAEWVAATASRSSG